MPIKISSKLKSALPAAQREDIEAFLQVKAADTCHLCEGSLNFAAEQIVADHDTPTEEGGATIRDNLNLTHEGCNAFKRNHATVNVRPFLRFSQFFRGQRRSLKYGDCLDHFGIAPRPSHISRDGNMISISFADGTQQTTPVVIESVGEEIIETCFMPVPAVAIFNDDECQPRNINSSHIWQIFLDISRNPLHESPGLRLSPDKKGVKLLLFDGQHKTIATWLHARKEITAKIYLNLDKQSTIRLVNSVQKLIKKLPLSPFELAAKMSEEFRDLADKYEAEVSTAKASEAGFLRWLDVDQRRRGKAAFQDALIQDVMEDPNLTFTNFVKRAGDPKPDTTNSAGYLTEAVFRNKILRELIHVDPLTENFEGSRTLRQTEKQTIVDLLNSVAKAVYEPAVSKDATQKEKDRAKRFSYQSSILYVSSLLRKAVGHHLAVASPNELLEKELSPDSLGKVQADIRRLVEHPVWTCDLSKNPRLREVQNALSKNQDAKRVFENVGLKLGYMVGVDDLDSEIFS